MLLRSGVDSLEDLDASALPLATACRNAVALLPAAVPTDREEATLPTWRDLALQPKKRAPKLLSRRLGERHRRDLLAV